MPKERGPFTLLVRFASELDPLIGENNRLISILVTGIKAAKQES